MKTGGIALLPFIILNTQLSKKVPAKIKYGNNTYKATTGCLCYAHLER
jgi:hypothetical protein